MYQTCIVTFIDILGFRALVGSKSAEDVASILDTFRKSSGEADELLGLRVLSFSDSIIRVRPVTGISCLYYELLELVHVQAELINKGILIRGGVTCGEVVASNDGVFGPGFVGAYELESEFAVYPRIVLSPHLLHGAWYPPFDNNHDPKDEWHYVSELLRCGDDGVWFVDYLQAFPTELDEPETLPLWLANHRKTIINLVALASQKPNLSSLALKANWLTRYHNEFVQKLLEDRSCEYRARLPDLLVPVGDVHTLFEFGFTERTEGCRTRRIRKTTKSK